MSSTQSGAGNEPTGRPGRYQRSVSGLVGAMIILVLAVLVFIGFRGIVRDNPDAPPLRAIAYGQVLQPAAEQTGWPVAAPASLPQGWIATSVRWEPPAGANWHLGLLTSDEEYVGIEQSASTTDAMVEEFVGEDAQRSGSVELTEPQDTLGSTGDSPGAATTQWQRWTGSDGDVAVTTRVGEQTLLVVTTGTEEQLRSVVDSLRLTG
ncbi:DUF4245 domain-containing protein [Nocardioidaceae bacterium]|nr:DUF4245 domain-containing protein [Nocardioidaceae bacterium]